HGARHRDLVCKADRRRPAALTHRGVVWVRESATLPVPADTLVFSHVYLGALSLAGITPGLESDPHPSGPRRWAGLSGQYHLRLHAAGGGARCAAGRTARQSYFLPWGYTP